jgi:hypothetical protein
MIFINKKENFNKKEGIIFNNEKYSKKLFFRKRRHFSKKTFTDFFKYYTYYKKKINKNVNFLGIRRPDLSIIPSLHYSRIRFKTYKNTLLIKKLKSSNLFSGAGIINKNSNTSDVALVKNYFIKKKIYINRLNFLNKFNQVPGKNRYKSPFYYTFKYLQNFKTNGKNPTTFANNSKVKDLFSTRPFDWILVLTTTNTNMYANLTNLKGETVFYHTLRRVGFQTGGSSKRSSKVAVEKLGIFVGKFLKKKKFSKKSFLVIFKGLS